MQHKANIIYGVGATDAGSTISYTQMVFDDEIIAGLRRMWQGITIHDLTEEMALIKSLTPRGNFMSARHTRSNYRQHWYPNILSRDTYETWREKSESIEQICRRKAQDLITHHQPPSLPVAVETELERIIRDYIPNFSFEKI